MMVLLVLSFSLPLLSSSLLLLLLSFSFLVDIFPLHSWTVRSDFQLFLHLINLRCSSLLSSLIFLFDQVDEITDDDADEN